VVVLCHSHRALAADTGDDKRGDNKKSLEMVPHKMTTAGKQFLY
jgi:hypothetical protein